MEEVYIAYAALITLATVAIYAGAWGSLPPPSRKDGKKDVTEDDDEFDLDERISSSDAYLFPFIASIGLFGFYLALQYLSEEWINWLLSHYFAFIGFGSVWKVLVSLLKLSLGKNTWNSFDQTQLMLVKNRLELFRLSFRTPTPFLLPLAIIPSAVYLLSDPVTRPALITNVLSLSFAFNALCFLKLDSFKTGTILLSGLFLYDIWWVFGTDVMVRVAKTLDVPIKILWPKSGIFSNDYMLLGLGDIVIPGAFITLALRRDLFASPSRDSSKAFKKPYFRATIFAYVLGLATTMYVLHSRQAAQPALLYLSPACILSFIITAVIRGELKDAWFWKDEAQHKHEQDAMKVQPTEEKCFDTPPPAQELKMDNSDT